MRHHPTFAALCLVMALGCAESATQSEGSSAGPPPAGIVLGRLGAVAIASHSGAKDWVAAYDQDFGALVVGPLDASGVWRPVRVDDGEPRARAVGLAPSLALGPDGEPVVLYGAADGAVLLARRAQGAWSHSELAAPNGAAYASGAVAVDSAGGVHAAWGRANGAGLVLASLASGGCRAPDGGQVREVGPEQLAAAGLPSDHFGEHLDLAISPSAAVVFAFYDRARGNLVLGSCAGTDLDLRVIDGEAKDGHDTGHVGAWASLAVDGGTGRLGLAYLDADRGVLRFATSQKGEPKSVVVDDGRSDGVPFARYVGQLARLAFGQDSTGSTPRIGYLDASAGELRLASLDPFGAWRLVSVAPFAAGTPGSLDLIATGDDSVRLVSIGPNGALRVSDCEGTTCVTR